MDYKTYLEKDLPIVLKYNDKYDKAPWEDVLELCKKNDPEALYEAASRYRIGEGVEKNIETAVRYYEQVMNYQKHSGALFQIGTYYNSLETIEMRNRCIDYYQIGSKCGDGHCSSELGDLYKYGELVDQDYNKAIEYYILSINQGYVEAYNRLGETYLDLTDYGKAIGNFEKAYSLCDGFDKAWAAYRIGKLYYYGAGVPSDSAKALPFLLEASNGGLEHANCMLGSIYAYGETGEKNTEKALRFLANVTDEDKGDALFITGDILMKQDNTSEGIKYIEEAYKRGNQNALNVLDQVSTDVTYLKKRADENSPYAMVRLSMVKMAKGDGESMQEGFEWARKAYSLAPKSVSVMQQYCRAEGLDAHVIKQIGALDHALEKFKKVIKVVNELRYNNAIPVEFEKDMNYIYYDAGLCAYGLKKMDEAVELLGKADYDKYPYAAVLIAGEHLAEHSKQVVQSRTITPSSIIESDIGILSNILESENFESDFQRAHGHLAFSFILRVYKQNLPAAYEHCKMAYSYDKELAEEELSHYSVSLFGKVKYN